jgi:hypothetical protein
MLRRLPLLASLLVACSSEPGSSPHGGGGGGKADGDEPTITFGVDFTQSIDGSLLAGSPVRVHYALDRVTDCHTQSGGSDQWSVGGFAQFGTDQPQTFDVSRLDNGKVVPMDAELRLPGSASHVALWFQVSDRSGCVGYDSNNGLNYQFDIDRHGLGAVLDFAADNTDSQSESIHAGDQIVVHYAPERLADCAASSDGHAGWGITAHWQIDGGPVQNVQAARADGPDLVPSDPTLTVPRGRDLAMWFEATSLYGCHAVDSASGANYHFTVD